MPGCGITIDNVIAVPMSAPTNGDCRTQVTISGTIDDKAGPCPSLTITTLCPCGAPAAKQTCTSSGIINADGTHSGLVVSGFLAAGKWQATLETNCCCGESIHITVACPSMGCSETFKIDLPCAPSCCPILIASADVALCDNGAAVVKFTLTAQAPLTANCPPIAVELDFGDGSAPEVAHLTPQVPYITTAHAYPAGAHQPSVKFVSPQGCPPTTIPFTVVCPDQKCCPKFRTRVDVVPCDALGQSTVTVWADVRVPHHCPPAEVRFVFEDGSHSPSQTFASHGYISDTRNYGSGDHIVTIEVISPAGCAPQEIAFKAPCPPLECCPVITGSATPGLCDADGNALVDFFISVTPSTAPGCPPTNVVLDFEGSGSGTMHTFSTPGDFHETQLYGPGKHKAFVKTLAPDQCVPVAIDFEVRCPPCCPEISSNVSYGECDAKGNAEVRIVVTVTPSEDPDCLLPEVVLDFDGKSAPASHTFTDRDPFTFDVTRTYQKGVAHKAFVKIPGMDGCKSHDIDIEFRCPKCCPNVTVTPCIPDCDGKPNREVKFDITVTPKGAPCPAKPVTFQMDFGDGAKGQTVTIPAGGAPYIYTETHLYTGAEALHDNVAFVQVTQPADCVGPYGMQIIPACCKKNRAEWCRILLLTMSGTFAAALLYLLFAIVPKPPMGACPTCAPFQLPINVLLNIFYVLLVIGLVQLAAYLIWCRKCSCGWFYRLLWRVLFAAGLFYAIFAGCAQPFLALLLGLALMWWALLFLQAWQKACCVPDCKVLDEVLKWLALALGIAGAMVLQSGGGGCLVVLFTLPFLGKFTFLGIATLVLAALAATSTVKCP